MVASQRDGAGHGKLPSEPAVKHPKGNYCLHGRLLFSLLVLLLYENICQAIIFDFHVFTAAKGNKSFMTLKPSLFSHNLFCLMSVLLGAGIAFPLHLQSAFPSRDVFCASTARSQHSEIVTIVINNNNKMSFLPLHYLFCRFTINLKLSKITTARDKMSQTGWTSHYHHAATASSDWGSLF